MTRFAIVTYFMLFNLQCLRNKRMQKIKYLNIISEQANLSRPGQNFRFCFIKRTMENAANEEKYGQQQIADFILNKTRQHFSYDQPSNSSSDFYFFTVSMYLYVQPILCVFGFLGNFISVFVFCSKPLRNASSNVYLTALSCTSFVFCLSNFLVWLETVQVQIIHQEVICQSIVYITYVCSFLTVWYVVCITFENFIVTVNLRLAVIVCTVHKARIIVTSLAVTAIVLYTFALWTTKVKRRGGEIYCDIEKEYQNTLHVFTYVDIFLTMAVPFIVMFFFLGAVYVKHIIVRVSCSRNCAFPNAKRPAKRRGGRNDSLTKITRVLLAIGSSYFILSVPSCVNKIRTIILYLRDQQEAATRDYWAVLQFCQMIYYLSFCLNFLFYLKWSVNYRKALKDLFQFLIYNRDSDSKTIEVPLLNIFSRKPASQEYEQVATYV